MQNGYNEFACFSTPAESRRRKITYMPPSFFSMANRWTIMLSRTCCVHCGLERSAGSAMGTLACRSCTGPAPSQVQPSANFWYAAASAETAVTDAIRKDWCVIPLEEQERMIRDANQAKPLGPSNIRDCR